jgi:hypothetical protein
MIKLGYVKLVDVKMMIDKMYKQNIFNIKREAEMKKLYEVAENAFNKMEDPQNALLTLSQNNVRTLTCKLYTKSTQ